MNGLELAFQLLPARYLDQRCRAACAEAEELRMRIGHPLMLLRGQKEYPLPGEVISEGELMRTLEKATGASLHTAAPALARGFISYRGLRIGVCGTAVVQDGLIRGFRNYTSLSIRIFRECRGICDRILNELESMQAGNLLILSPPGGGKTTALREMIRCLSKRGTRVGLVDERWEIAGAELGREQFDLGSHCDVISGVPKAEGSMMLLRGMNPELIAMDEITQKEDISAIREIIGCGVRLIATAHAAEPEDLLHRPVYRAIMDEHLFAYAVQIRQDGAERSYHLRRLKA